MDTNKKLRLKTRAIVVFFSVVIIGVVAVMLVSPFFNVNEVICEGNNRLTADAIIQSSGIVYGKNILMQGTGKARRSIANMPMIESVSVKRVLPDKIKITVNERTPAAYISTGGALAVTDTGGRILEIIADDRVEKITSANTPQKKNTEENSENSDNNNSDNSGSNNNSGAENPDSNNSENPENNNENSGGQAEADNNNADNNAENTDNTVSTEENNSYGIPLVAGLELSKAEPGRQAESQTKEKLNTALNLFSNLDKTGLLSRATYIDITDLSDVTLIIENRLEIQLGNLNNIEYRCAFLSKVINEKISATEHVVMDYRTDDIYVRQPDDGKARMVPKATSTAKPDSSDDPQSSESESQTDKPSSNTNTNSEQEYL